MGVSDVSEVYPIWKKSFWEAFRIFFLAAGAVVVAQINVGVNYDKWQEWLVPLLLASAVAGLKALFKWAREHYARGDYQNLLYKLPL